MRNLKITVLFSKDYHLDKLEKFECNFILYVNKHYIMLWLDMGSRKEIIIKRCKEIGDKRQ